MGAVGYAKKPRKAREEKAGPPLKCVRHPARNAAAWASFGKAPGMGVCEACHNHLIAKWNDRSWVKSVHGDRASAERAVVETLQREVA